MSESFKDRLARLRREAPAPPAAAGADGTMQRAEGADAPPTWWRARMAKREKPRPQLAPTLDAGPPVNLREFSNERGFFAAREVEYELDHRHGDVELRSVHAVDRSLFALTAKDARLATLDPARALYLDIETTGLSGGAGTKAFLVGLGRFERERFSLWQGFLRGPEEEAALLHEVAARIRDRDALVTFFGKTFDRHRLEDKMRVHGVAPPFAERPHLDLYHPLRALYRPALDDSRLQTLERELCNVARVDDLPGAFAPEAWYDFLAGRAHRLERVFEHNRDDVLSLVTLCAHLGALHFGAAPATAPESRERRLEAARLRGLARALAHAKRFEECAAVAQSALDAASTPHARVELFDLAIRAWGRCGAKSQSQQLASQFLSDVAATEAADAAILARAERAATRRVAAGRATRSGAAEASRATENGGQ